MRVGSDQKFKITEARTQRTDARPVAVRARRPRRWRWQRAGGSGMRERPRGTARWRASTAGTGQGDTAEGSQTQCSGVPPSHSRAGAAGLGDAPPLLCLP